MKRTSLAAIGALALCVSAAIFWAPTPNYLPFFNWATLDIFILAAWTLVVFAATGVVLLWKATVGWDREKPVTRRPRQLLPDVVLRKLPPLPRHRHVPLIMGLPNFGLYWGFIPFLLVLFVSFRYRMPMGLMPRVPSRYVAARPQAPESESLGVYVRYDGRGYVFYVNGQPVPREQLRARLQDELNRRSFWIVYFEGDEDVAYGQVVYAVDTIRGLGAQAYFLTPRIRAEFNQPQNLTKR